MKGLVIKSPWIDLILNGQKTWEIRSRKTNVRGRIAIIQSGTGLVYGEAVLTDCIELTREMLERNVDRHKIDDLSIVTYEHPCAWVVKDAQRYEKPVPYKHPQGAVVWVNI